MICVTYFDFTFCLWQFYWLLMVFARLFIPITLVLDNARYQKCKLVTELADFFEIELLYLPSYSPQLNIIERLWKWIKKDALYCKWYPKFDVFKQAIKNSLDKTKHSHYKPELESLLSLKFQSFEKAKIVTL